MYDPDPRSALGRGGVPAWMPPRGRFCCVSLSRPTMRILERAWPNASRTADQDATSVLLQAMLTEREGLAGEALRDEHDEAFPVERRERQPPARKPLTQTGSSPNVRRVVETAAWLARAYHSARIESAHLLLALLMDGGGEVDGLLRSYGIDREHLRRRLVDALGSGPREPVAGSGETAARQTCSACGRRYPDKARYCGFCGASLPRSNPADIALVHARACRAAGQFRKALRWYVAATKANPAGSAAWIEGAACLPERATIRRACWTMAGLAVDSADERQHADVIATYRRLAWWQRWVAWLVLPPHVRARLHGTLGAVR